jgi:diguanylate cyclase
MTLPLRQTPPTAKTHWLVRMNHRNRSFTYVMLFVALGAHLRATGASPALWTLLSVQCLLYPQLAYWRARLSKHQRSAEMSNLMLDVVAGAMWSAGLGFPLWISFTLFAGNGSNMVVFYGYRGLIRLLLCSSIGLGLVFASGHWPPLHLETNLSTTLLCIVTLTLFGLSFAQDGYRRAMDQHRSKEKLRTQFEEIEALQAQLQEQAVRDPLTGLFNRRHLDVALDTALERCRATGTSLALLLFDIDHFKQINDAHGHAAGDAILQMLAQLMLRHVRPQDIACRYGGEEFLVVMADVSLETAHQRANALRQAFEKARVRNGGDNVSATVSCGVVAYLDHSAEAAVLIRRADEALYLAKAQGRNRVVAG